MAGIPGAFENAAVGLALLDSDLRVIQANAALREMLGRDAEGIRDAPLASLFHAENFIEGGMSEGAALSSVFVAEGRLVETDGVGVLVRVKVSPVREGGGRVAVIEDTTRLREAEEALAESEGRFRQLFENSVDALFIHDENGRMLDCNAEACRSLGYEREELLTLSVKDIAEDIISEKDREAMTGGTPWQRAMNSITGESVGAHENRHRRKDGTTFPVEVALSSMDYGGRRMIFAAVRDITERKTLEEQLSHLAFHDSLTGLPNRALFIDRLEHALRFGDRREFGIAVLFLDLDNFKNINDSYGHEVGDGLLVEIGNRLASCVRAADTVARLAGDEFTILLEDVGDLQEITRVVERIESVFKEPITVGRRDLRVTASIGVVTDARSGRTPMELLNHADTAMYSAKRAGKARYRIYGSGGPVNG